MTIDEIPVIYNDEDLLVVDKPQGLATGFGRQENLCEIVFAKFPQVSLIHGFREGEGGLLNRLDNDTGGLVLFAKNDIAFQYYKNEMKNRRVKKTYCAICNGVPVETGGIVTIPIAHHKSKKRKMVRADKGSYRSKPQDAETVWQCLETVGDYSLISVALLQGVRHQIRVHLSCIGLPILGDRLYNKKREGPFVGNHHALYCTGVSGMSFSGKALSIHMKCPLVQMWETIKKRQ